MKIPKFWSKGEAEGTSPSGKRMAFSCWRPSQVSEKDAHESAVAAAKRVLDAFLSGEKLDPYTYGCIPLREEVLNKVDDGQGKIIAVVTRNSYGSLVLNAERAMFVDIDFPPVTTGEATKHFFARIFGRAKVSPEAKREEKARKDVEHFMAERRNGGFGSTAPVRVCVASSPTAFSIRGATLPSTSFGNLAAILCTFAFAKLKNAFAQG